MDKKISVVSVFGCVCADFRTSAFAIRMLASYRNIPLFSSMFILLFMIFGGIMNLFMYVCST